MSRGAIPGAQSGAIAGLTKPALWNVPSSGNAVYGGASRFQGSYVFVPVTITVTKARIRVQVQSGNISVAVYNAAGTSRLATTGAIACPATGNQDVTFTAAVTLAPGVYFVGMSIDNTTASVGINGTQQANGGAFTASAHPAPASVTVDDGSAGSVPSIGLF